MIVKCPRCGSENLGDRWARGRKLQQCCYDCEFKAPERTPEILEIKTIKKIQVGRWPGFHYEIFDRYGHIKTVSRSYIRREWAIEGLDRELEYGTTDEAAGPYTGILWPDMVIVKGELRLALKNGG